MEKSTTKKKIAVFISGRGSNLKSLIKNSKLKKVNLKYI
jgi:folate-dependent phosphoribosylglycinamide formyltransferase PurN